MATRSWGWLGVLAACSTVATQHCEGNDSRCRDTAAASRAETAHSAPVSYSTQGNVRGSELVVFMTTFHNAAGVVRFNATIRTLSELTSAQIDAVVVDSSPVDVREGLKDRGAAIHQQTGSGKAAALRQAAALAARLPNVSADTWLCFQEPEKTDMVRKWHHALSGLDPAVGVVVPRRREPEFGQSYAIEQWHSENFGNGYLNAVAAGQTESLRDFPNLDWFFGPLAFRAKHAHHWIDYRGDGYDAQMVPIVLAARAGVRIADVPVRYSAEPEMKAEEEGSVDFVKKRFRQLTALTPVVAAAIEAG